MKKSLFFHLIPFLFWGIALFSAHASESPRIRGFRVEGLERTKLSVVEPYYRPYEGKPLSLFSRDKLIQDLRSLGIFHSIEIFPGPVENGEVIIRIYVEEKWTLVPIPLGGATGSGKFYGGFMFLESNLLGYNKKLYGGGFISTAGWKGMVGYIDPGFLGSGASLFLAGVGGIDQIKNSTADERVYQRYRTLGLALRSELLWKPAPHLALGGGVEFQEQSVDGDYEKSLAIPDPARVLGPVVSLRYQDLFYDRILVYGLSVQTRYKYKFSLRSEEESFDEYSFTAQYYAPILGVHRLGLKSLGIYAPETPGILEPRISERIFKTLPEGATADSLLGGQVAMEFLLADFGWGAMTLLFSYEGGTYIREKEAPEYTHGPGGGFRLYLSKIAVPAFGFDLAYNMDTGNLYVTVNVGMQM